MIKIILARHNILWYYSSIFIIKLILVELIFYKMKRGWLMKKIFKQVFGLMMLSSIILPVSMMMFVGNAKAINPWGDPFAQNVGYDSFNDIKMGKKDPRTIAANVINILLGMLGVIAMRCLFISCALISWPLVQSKEQAIKFISWKAILLNNFLSFVFVSGCWPKKADRGTPRDKSLSLGAPL